MSALLDVLSWVLLVGGGIVAVIAGIGVNRMPDVFSRMHAAGMLDTLGAVAITLGLVLQAGLTVMALKLGLMVVFLMITTATAAHALAKSALAVGIEPAGTEDMKSPSARGEEVEPSPR